MRDDARLSYCDRKASCMSRSSNRRKMEAAEKLLSWALASFSGASKQVRAFALSTRADILEELGQFRAAAEDSKTSGRLYRALAVPALHQARALLRESG